MQTQISSYLKFLMISLLLFSCKEKENNLGPSDLEILANRIMSEDEAETYIKSDDL